MRVTAFIRKSSIKATYSMATVYFRVRDNDGVDLKASSELRINPNYWSPERQGYKTRVSLVSDEKRNQFDVAVKEITNTIAKEYYIGADHEWLKQLIFVYHHPNAFKLKGKVVVDTLLTNCIEKYASEKLSDEKQKRIYRHLIEIIKRYQMFQSKINKVRHPELNIDTMTAEHLKSLEHFIRDEYKYKKLYPNIFTTLTNASDAKEQRSGNYLSGLMSRLRSAFRWIIKQGATNNDPFLHYESPKLLYGTPYYITVEERNAIYELDLKEHQNLAVYRDVFIFQSLIGCRFSDLIRLTTDNIINGCVEYIPSKTREKTGRTVRVPLNSKAKFLLDRFVNRSKKTKTLIPHNSLAEYNKAIKELLALANITRAVPTIDPQTHEEKIVPINELASSHMARRTFVGNMYKKVKDPNLIASMSGHVDGSKAFSRYRAIDDEMKQELVDMIN